MLKIKCYYFLLEPDYLSERCSFVNQENEYLEFTDKFYSYLSGTLTSDIYYRSAIDEHFKIIELIENNPNEIYDDGGGQQFCLEFHHDKVIFYHNEFDEEDGYPVLSCSLHTFKTSLIAWNAFLQLPKSIHSVVETVIEE